VLHFFAGETRLLPHKESPSYSPPSKDDSELPQQYSQAEPPYSSSSGPGKKPYDGETPAPKYQPQPPAGYQQPPSGYQQPPSGYKQPPAAGYQPPPRSEYDSPPTGSKQPPAARYQQPPVAGYKQPQTGYEKPPTAGYQQPQTGYEKPPAAGYQKPHSGYEKPPAVYDKGPAGAKPWPPASYQPPSSSYGYGSQGELQLLSERLLEESHHSAVFVSAKKTSLNSGCLLGSAEQKAIYAQKRSTFSGQQHLLHCRQADVLMTSYPFCIGRAVSQGRTVARASPAHLAHLVCRALLVHLALLAHLARRENRETRESRVNQDTP
jgi:hypothetical protein